MNNDLIERFELAVPVFDSIQGHFNQRDKYIRGVNSVKMDAELKYNSSNAFGISFLVALLLSIFTVGPVVFLLYTNEIISSAAPYPILFLVLWFVLYFVFKKRYENKADNDPASEQKINDLFTKAKAEEDTIRQIYIDNQDIIDFFPPDYRYSYAVQKIFNILINRRADSLKEAINIFEEDEYRMRMEAKMDNMISLQLEMCSYLVGIADEIHGIRRDVNYMARRIM